MFLLAGQSTEFMSQLIENNYLSNFKNIISEKESNIVSDEQLVLICTGSQGEQNAAYKIN